MPFLTGLVVVSIIIYFAFIRKSTDTDEETFRKVAQTAISVFVIGVVCLIVLLKCES